MEEAFTRPRNITYDRYMLLATKQSKGRKSIEHFFGKLKELSENLELGNQEHTFIRDLFFANIQDSEIQKKLLKDTVDSAQALSLAIIMELGQRNSLQITISQPNLQAGECCNITTSVNFVTQIKFQIFKRKLHRRIKCVEIAASLG